VYTGLPLSQKWQDNSRDVAAQKSVLVADNVTVDNDTLDNDTEGNGPEETTSLLRRYQELDGHGVQDNNSAPSSTYSSDPENHLDTLLDEVMRSIEHQSVADPTYTFRW
jgi:hypothetical protein